MHNSRDRDECDIERLKREVQMGKILVVDDDPAMHEIIEGAFADGSYSISYAHGGQEGLEMLARETFDLALVDYLLPDTNGLEFLDRLNHAHPDLKAIIITAFGTPETVLGAIRQRVCDFLIKPFSIADLRGAVGAAFDDAPPSQIEVISAEPHWVQLRVPCDLAAVPWLQKLLMQLKADLPEETREAMAYAFREMLNNAIEHGGKLDPAKFVEVLCVRLKRAIIYWIKDPSIRARSNTPPSTIHRATRFATSPSATKRDCAPVASAFCSPINSWTTWSTTNAATN
jgi:CheY-like chemotaxis protein